jgi:hypothetical protein
MTTMFIEGATVGYCCILLGFEIYRFLISLLRVGGLWAVGCGLWLWAGWAVLLYLGVGWAVGVVYFLYRYCTFSNEKHPAYYTVRTTYSAPSLLSPFWMISSPAHALFRTNNTQLKHQIFGVGDKR